MRITRRIIAVLLCAVTVLALMSCGATERNETESSEPTVAGVWIVEEMTDEQGNTAPEGAFGMDISFDFKDDGTLTLLTGREVQASGLTWELDGTDLKVINAVSDSTEGTFDGETITFPDFGGTGYYLELKKEKK